MSDVKFFGPPPEFEPEEQGSSLVDELWEGREVTLISNSGVGTYRIGKITPSWDRDEGFTVSVRVDEADA